jgi:hypothetical protein
LVLQTRLDLIKENIMKLSHIFALTLMASAGAAYAADMTAADTDADGMISADEFAAAYPDVDPATFLAVDVNADGMIDASEFETATGEGGLLAG